MKARRSITTSYQRLPFAVELLHPTILRAMPAKPVTVHCTEDEMIFLHANGAWAETLYASCPEQAHDFFAAHGHRELASVEDWRSALKSFQEGWTSKYGED